MNTPEPADTADLRAGPPLHDALLALLPLIGKWRGTGVGTAPSSDATFRYAQSLRFTHDGRPFLAYEAWAWIIDEIGAVVRPAWRESGFWRPGAGPDDIEVVLASNTGQSLLYTGSAGELRWELTTASAQPTPTAVRVDGERRLYALVDSATDAAGPRELAYVTELAPAGHDYAPHLNARLAPAP